MTFTFDIFGGELVITIGFASSINNKENKLRVSEIVQEVFGKNGLLVKRDN